MGGGGSKSEAKEIEPTLSSITNEINAYSSDQNVETFNNKYDSIDYTYMILGITFLLVALFIHSKSRKKK